MALAVWAHSNSYTGVPPNAVFAGQDSDGDTIYVGRAEYGGDHIPAKVMLHKKCAYVAFGGQEILVHDFEVLCGQGFTWVPSGGGAVPPRSVVGGQTNTGEPLYIGRAHWEGTLTPGKVHPSHGCLYIPYGGLEHKVDPYDVLVEVDAWVSTSVHSGIPPNAVLAGHDSDGDAIYVGRAYHEGDHLPAKVVPSKSKAYVSWGSQEHEKYEYDILCGIGFHWLPGSGGSIAAGAVTSGLTVDGEPLYIGRGHISGSLTPGKIHPSHGVLYVPFGGAEHSLSTYEVLVRSHF